MNATPLALYLVAGVAYAVHFGTRSPSSGRVCDSVAGVRSPRAHLHHRHADDAGRSRAASRHHRRDLGVRVGPRARLSLYRDDDGRTGHGDLHRPADGRPAVDSGHQQQRGGPTAGAREPLVRDPRVLAARGVRDVRSRVRDKRHLRAPLQGAQGQASRRLLRPPAVPAGARRHERTRGHVRLGVPDPRTGGRRHLADPGAAGRRRPASAGDVPSRSEDLHGAALLAGVHVLAVRAAGVRLGRTSCGLAVDGRVRDPDAELRADRVLRHQQPQLLPGVCAVRTA